MSEEVDVPRRLPAARPSPTMFGANLIGAAVTRMTLLASRTDPIDASVTSWLNLSGFGFALFAPPGSGKTAVAAQVVRDLRTRLQWLTALHTPWCTAEWLALNLTPYTVDAHTGTPVVRHLTDCRLLCIDGLGEENEKLRERVVNLVKSRVDAGKPMVITSRLALDGPGSLTQLYPNLRAALTERFIYATPKR